jgi:hypothetical protein
MKSVVLVLVTSIAIAAACASTPAPAAATTVTTGDSDAGATYVCPMHPEVTSEAPGRCPKCGMKLVPKK